MTSPNSRALMRRRSSLPNIKYVPMTNHDRRVYARQQRAKREAELKAARERKAEEKRQRMKQLRLQTKKQDSRMRRQYSMFDGTARCKYCNTWIPELLYEDHIVSHPTQIRQRIWLGNADNSKDMDVIAHCGITHILNCTKEIPVTPQTKNAIKSFKRIAIQDKTSETILDYVNEVCQYIEQSLSESKKHILFIHCREGRSRSVSFLCTYLMWKEGMSFLAALSDIRSKRHVVLPNSRFYMELELLDKQLQSDTLLSPGSKKFSQPNYDFVLAKSMGFPPGSKPVSKPVGVGVSVKSNIKFKSKKKKKNKNKNKNKKKAIKGEKIDNDELKVDETKIDNVRHALLNILVISEHDVENDYTHDEGWNDDHFDNPLTLDELRKMETLTNRKPRSSSVSGAAILKQLHYQLPSLEEAKPAKKKNANAKTKTKAKAKIKSNSKRRGSKTISIGAHINHNGTIYSNKNNGNKNQKKSNSKSKQAETKKTKVTKSKKKMKKDDMGAAIALLL